MVRCLSVGIQPLSTVCLGIAGRFLSLLPAFYRDQASYFFHIIDIYILACSLSGHTAAQLSSHDLVAPPIRVPLSVQNTRHTTRVDSTKVAEELISYKNILALLDLLEISWTA